MVLDHTLAFEQDADPTEAEPTSLSGNLLHFLAGFWAVQRAFAPNRLWATSSGLQARRCEML